MLYDTGERSFYRDLQQNLLALGVRKLSLLMLSHHDQDHDGNWLNISRYWQVDKILAGQAQAYVVQHNIPVVSCRAGQNWNWDGVHFELLTLPADHYTSDNDRSCILRIIAAGKAILLVGDLSSKGETKLVKQYANALDAHILVLGHHGSFSSSSSVFLDHVNPQVAIASSGYNNRFHHPDERLLAALKKEGFRCFEQIDKEQLKSNYKIRCIYIQWLIMSLIGKESLGRIDFNKIKSYERTRRIPGTNDVLT